MLAKQGLGGEKRPTGPEPLPRLLRHDLVDVYRATKNGPPMGRLGSRCYPTQNETAEEPVEHKEKTLSALRNPRDAI